MRFFQFATVSVMTLASTSAAWSITFYDNNACDGSEDVNVYKVFEGEPSEDCHEIIAGEEGASCEEYDDGGDTGPVDCTVESFPSPSFRVDASDAACRFFTRSSCNANDTDGTFEDYVASEEGAADCMSIYNGEPALSFWCTPFN